MTVGLILESLVAILLVVTVYYCVILNRRLTGLRSGQDEFMSLVVELNEATRRAQNSVEDLKSSTLETGKELAESVSSARVLVDELAMITEAGNNLANRIERQLTGATAVRPAGKIKPRTDGATNEYLDTALPDEGLGEIKRREPQSETERELLRTLKEVR